jgi:hypothetical protein
MELKEAAEAATATAAAAAGSGGADAGHIEALGGKVSAELQARRRWEHLQQQLREAGAGGSGGGADADSSALAGSFAADRPLPPPMSRFFSKLGSLVGSAARHAITPASAPLEIGSHAAGRLNFQIYDLVQNPGGGGGFDLAGFKEALAQLALPTQTVTFTTHAVPLGSDEAVAAAFARSRAQAIVPALHVDGSFTADARTYLDAHELSAGLRHAQHEADGPSSPARALAFASEKARTDADGGAARLLRLPRGERAPSRQIPVFIFELEPRALDGAEAAARAGVGAQDGQVGVDGQVGEVDGQVDGQVDWMPIFLDRFFAAKAIDGLVLVVASSRHPAHAHGAGGAGTSPHPLSGQGHQQQQSAWPSHLVCNGKHISWDLASPLRHALAATAQLVRAEPSTRLPLSPLLSP